MILILSDSNDITTYHVAKWLEHFSKEVYIHTNEDKLHEIILSNNSLHFFANKKLIAGNTIEAYWYRRGEFDFHFVECNSNLPVEIAADIKKEKSILKELLNYYMLNIPNLSSSFNSDLNRVHVLDIAKSLGLLIPEYLICTTKKDVIYFIETHKKIITKPLWNGLAAIRNNILYINYTCEFTKHDIENLPNSFAPSLLMKYVEKKYELRVFYLNGKSYTMAILSQNDPKTMIDYRKYNKIKPNRNVAYNLPKDIERKICMLMNYFGLKTGSIDIIVTHNNDFVFLEINPVGQFLNVSHACNYYLEKEIAEYLTTVSKSIKTNK